MISLLIFVPICLQFALAQRTRQGQGRLFTFIMCKQIAARFYFCLPFGPAAAAAAAVLCSMRSFP